MKPSVDQFKLGQIEEFIKKQKMGAVLEKIPAPDAYFGGEALSEALSKAFVNELFEHYEKKLNVNRRQDVAWSNVRGDVAWHSIPPAEILNFYNQLE